MSNHRGSPLLWVLSPLLPEGYDLRLDAKSAASIANAREVLRNDSTMDASQAGAVVDGPTREVSLIQGPPGIGNVRLVTSFGAFPESYCDASF